MTQLWSVVVAEEGQASLPSIHLEAPFVIGSSIVARVRLPASVAESEHVRVEPDGTWHALAAVTARRVAGDGGDGDGADAGDDGEVGEGVTIDIGAYHVRIRAASADATPTPPQRTESLARELMRNMLGTAAAPTLEIEGGKLAGAKRPLAPPESTFVIGRGDEANWIIADHDLSRAHVEIRRSWDGVFIADLDSKNGTKVNGTRIRGDTLLRDGARIELGKVAFVFRDPTEKHLPGSAPKASAPSSSSSTSRVTTSEDRGRASALPFYGAVAIMLLALVGLVWVLSS